MTWALKSTGDMGTPCHVGIMLVGVHVGLVGVCVGYARTSKREMLALGGNESKPTRHESSRFGGI